MVDINHTAAHCRLILASIDMPTLVMAATAFLAITDRLVAKARAHESWPLHHDISNPPLQSDNRAF